tara:strand:+ start:181 stop:666 length:486 start_codon:yes stop_codon:yes gene_type:complete
MELFTYTKITKVQETATLETLISNINDPDKSPTDGLGKATAVRVFGNARMTGLINDTDGQIIGKALWDDINGIVNNPKRSETGRKRAAKALELFSQWKKDFHASKQAEVAKVAKPVVEAKPAPVAVSYMPNSAQAPAASLADLTAMMMSLTATVNTLVANS